MATLYTLRSGATQHPEAMMGFLASRQVITGGVFDISGTQLKCAQQTVPDMTVKVNDGYALIPLSDLSFVHPVELDGGDGSVTIGANSSGNDRIDAIVLYIDRSASANTTATNVATLYVVEGTPAGSPVAPTNSEIQTEIGASNPFIRLADIAVSNGASSIVTANITDKRREVRYGFRLSNGWESYNAVIPTRTASDDPEYEISFAGVDLTGVLQAGMKLKLTQSTDKFFFITKVTLDGSDTDVRLYGGTDYDVVDTSSTPITAVYFSRDKAPKSFPMSPTKWTVTTSSTASDTQATPTTATWYNPGTLTIDIPIGAWHVSYEGVLGAYDSASITQLILHSTLSTANNSESEGKFTAHIRDLSGAVAGKQMESTVSKHHYLDLTAKDTYYLNVKCIGSGVDQLGWNVGTLGQTTIIRAVCAYL